VALRTVGKAHPDKRIVLWFMDEAYVGQHPQGDAKRQGAPLLPLAAARAGPARVP
jgi:hypothetical protein